MKKVGFALVGILVTIMIALPIYKRMPKQEEIEYSVSYAHTEEVDEKDIIWSTLQDNLDANDIVYAALMGVIQCESNFKPEPFDGSSKEEFCKFRSFGLMNWNNKTTLNDFWNWCESNGRDVNDYESQVLFLIEDISTSYPEMLWRFGKYGNTDLGVACGDIWENYCSNECRMPNSSSPTKIVSYAKSLYASYSKVDLDTLVVVIESDNSMNHEVVVDMMMRDYHYCK